MTPDEIFNAVKDLPLLDVVRFLALNKIVDLSLNGLEKVRKLIHEKTILKKYGFFPNKNETRYLKSVSDREYFKEFGYLLPDHKYSDAIRTGYLIAHLNKVGGESNRARVKEIIDLVHERPNGTILVRVIYLVTTGAIVPIVDYLRELKRKKYEKEYLTSIFDEILIEWNTYSYFVSATTKKHDIMKTIHEKMNLKQKLIMVFAYGSAKDNTTQAVADVLKEKPDNYFYDSKNVTEGEKEVHASYFYIIDN